jgi:GcvH upstream region-like protein
MLNFFRQYQRYFFFVITVVIIITFSFFGTYDATGSNVWREQIAFTAINGKEIPRGDVDEMAIFLATNSEDKRYFGGAWGPNFLNDGVIQKNFLETGLAQELVLAYQADLQEELDKRLAKEQKYTLYTHPQARFIGIENAWSHFSPEMNTYYRGLKTSTNSLDAEAFQNRVKLYLAEKKLPAPMLRQILHYQENQQSWLSPDETLDQLDLSLFGYHTLEDWFSPRFTRLISEFIINTSILAEAKGYQVSKAEVLADLARQTQLSYQQNQNNPQLGVASPQQYYQEQLRRMNMDQNRAVKVWRQVLLFRRYFDDAGAVALVDSVLNQKFQKFAQEQVNVEMYQLPKALRFGDYASLQKLQVYLQAVTKPVKREPLALSQDFLKPAEVAKTYPELVQKRYEIEVAQVTQKSLQARIGIRQIWEWEVEDQHWDELKKQFPELALKPASTRDERFEILDNLESITRSKVDQLAKQEIVKQHPEWIEQALAKANPQKLVIGLRTQGGKAFFSGLDKKEARQELIKALDQAPLNQAPTANQLLAHYTADQQVYYSITVLDRAPQEAILTFEEAAKDGTLDDVRDRLLEKYYVMIREKQPLLYQKENQEWKPFSAVQELVANEFFENTLKALESTQKSVFPDQDKKGWSKDQAASLRFYSYLKQAQEALKKNNAQAQVYIKPSRDQKATLADYTSLADQWKLEKVTLAISREGRDEGVDKNEVFKLSPNEWSSLKAPANGHLSFYQVKDKGQEMIAASQEIKEQTLKMHQLLAAEAQRQLMRQVLQELKEKNALSLAYMQKNSEEAPETAQQEEMTPL